MNIIAYCWEQKQPSGIEDLMHFTTVTLQDLHSFFEDPEIRNLHIALGIDSEFSTVVNGYAKPIGVSIDDAWYEHPDCEIKQFPPFKGKLAIADHLGFVSSPQSKGVCRKLQEGEKVFNTLVVWWLHYFSPKDYSIVFKDHKSFWTKYEGEFDQKRYLKQKNLNPNHLITTDLVFETESVKRELKIKPIDFSKMQGIQSLESFVSNAGIEFTSKNKFDFSKIDPLEAYKNSPDEFRDYAIGDSKILYQAICETIQRTRQVYGLLNVDKEFWKVGNTIGSTVSKMVLGGIHKNLPTYDELSPKSLENLKLHNNRVKFNLNDWGNFYGLYDDFELDGITNATPFMKLLIDGSHNKKNRPTPINVKTQVNYCIDQSGQTIKYLGMVDGGRAKNERPLIPFDSQKAGIIDVDIKGCYTTILSKMRYPIGSPKIITYDLVDVSNPITDKRQSLENFLAEYKEKLVSGLWYARISTSENFSFHQDLIYSKILNKAKVSDENDENTNKGNFILALRQIVTGTLTHDLLQILQACSTDNEWNEIIKKIKIDAAMIYPKDEECDTFEEWAESYKAGENNKWYAVPIGPGWIEELKQLREDYKLAENNSMQTLVKLMINTTYGSIASQHFTISNVLVANNITAKARGMVWLLAKALGFYQTITDGGSFNAHKVNDWNDKRPGLNTLTFVSPEEKRLVKKTLKDNQFGRHLIQTSLSADNESSIAMAALEHTCHFFHKLRKGAKIDILTDPVDKKPIFELEVKSINDIGVWQSQTNYGFGNGSKLNSIIAGGDLMAESNLNSEEYDIQDDTKNLGDANLDLLDKDLISIRGWTKEVYQDEEARVKLQDNQKPIVHAFELLARGEERIPAVYPRVYQAQIAKLEGWKRKNNPNSQSHLKDYDYDPGDTISKRRLFSTVSLTAFKWQTVDQFKNWRSYYQRLQRESDGLKNVASFFEDSESHLHKVDWNGQGLPTINYQRVLEWIQKHIYVWDDKKSTPKFSPTKARNNYQRKFNN